MDKSPNTKNPPSVYEEFESDRDSLLAFSPQKRHPPVLSVSFKRCREDTRVPAMAVDGWL
jgi:hypothetical protein